MTDDSNVVKCYSGSSYAQQPRSFIWQGAEQQIESIIKQEYSPQGKLFLVTTPHGLLFNLEYLIELDQWQVSQAFLPKTPRRSF
jgi:hypothetical protein